MYSSLTPCRFLFSARCFLFLLIFTSASASAFSGVSLEGGYQHSAQKISGSFVTEKKIGLEWASSSWISAESPHHPVIGISTGIWELANLQLASIGASLGYCHSTPSYQSLCLVSGLYDAKKESIRTNIFEIEMQFTRFIGPDFMVSLDFSFFRAEFHSAKGILIGLSIGQKI